MTWQRIETAMANELITITQLKSLGVGVNLDNAALELMLDGEDEWLQRYAGPHSGPITVVRPINRGKIYVSRPVDTIWTAHYTFRNYEQWTLITPLPVPSRDGTYVYSAQLQAFGDAYDAELTYVPQLDTARRRTTLVELLKNTLAYTGNTSLEVPGMSADWQQQRQCILKQFDYRFGVA